MTSQEISEAIDQRKAQFIKGFPQRYGESGLDTVYFNHICTVLDHASILMRHDMNDLLSSTPEVYDEIQSAEISHKLKSDL